MRPRIAHHSEAVKCASRFVRRYFRTCGRDEWFPGECGKEKRGGTANLYGIGPLTKT